MSYSGARPLPISNGGTGTSSVPAFLAYTSSSLSSVTGDGTNYTVLYNATSFDTASAYNAGTGQYTVPITGNYYIVCGLLLTGLASGHTSGTVQINTNYINFGNPFAVSTSNQLMINASLMLSLTATNTIDVVLHVAGGAKAVSVAGQALGSGLFSYFGAYLII